MCTFLRTVYYKRGQHPLIIVSEWSLGGFTFLSVEFQQKIVLLSLRFVCTVIMRRLQERTPYIVIYRN